MPCYAFIPGSSNYMVGDDGSVWSRIKRGNTRKPYSTWKRLKTPLSHGYPSVHVRHARVRQLIAFFERGNTYQQTASKFNVAIGTVQAIIDGKTWKSVSGGVNRNRKTNCGNRLSEITVLEIEKGLATGKTYTQLAKQFSISLGTVHRIKHGKRRSSQ